jgi:hypothetical protein
MDAVRIEPSANDRGSDLDHSDRDVTMIRVANYLGAALVVGGMLTIGSAHLRAQETDEPEGIIRISDCINPAAPGASQGPTAGNCQTGNCPGAYAAGCPQGGYGHCGNGYCGNGYCGRGGCGNRSCHVCRKFHAFCSWLDPNGGCTVSPDHGWAPPGKVTRWTRPVAYQRFWPGQWTGEPEGGTPVRVAQVYRPTDTTQLGYYYQTVPQWMPNPAMYPGAPNPRQWHQPLCGPGGSYVGMNGCPSGNCPNGGVIDQGTIIDQGTPTPMEENPLPSDGSLPEPPVEPTAPINPPAPAAAEIELQPTPPGSAG